jgi:arginase
MSTDAFSGLHIIGVRYWDSRLAQADELALDALNASGVYEAAGIPFDVVEPRIAEELWSEDEITNLGLMGGAIAGEVAMGRRRGQAILMTGGHCVHATGILGGLQDAHGPAARIGLVWFDAHGDFNTPRTTLTGMLGGMPVAVCAGLAWPRWREGSHIIASLPTDRIILVDVRNLDPAEEQLICTTDAVIAAPAPGFPGQDLRQAVTGLAGRCDMIYLHIDLDILDAVFVPDHVTAEPDGPSLAQVTAAIDTVMATGKVVALAVVSIFNRGESSRKTVSSGIELVRAGLASWRRHGQPNTTIMREGDKHA